MKRAFTLIERLPSSGACPAQGFELMDDIVLSLTPEDPPHHIILAVKSGRPSRHRR